MYNIFNESSFSEKVPYNAHVLLPLLPHRHVAGLREREPLDLLNVAEEADLHAILRLVVVPVQQERRDVDEMDVVGDGPVLERPRDMELGRAEPANNSESARDAP